MKLLSPLDASFVYTELDNQYMHIAGLAIYDPSTAPPEKRESKGNVLGFKDILRDIEKTLHHSPTSRTRLVRVPGNVGHPYWIEDENFDIEYHVRHIALPEPGDWRQLCIQVARLHSRPLDMDRPLWEFYIIEGLDNIPGIPSGCYAMYSKIHHCAIDGATGADMTTNIHVLNPEDEPADPPPGYEWESEKMPTDIELLARASVDNFKRRRDVGKTIADTVKGVYNMERGVRAGDISRPHRGPRTRFSKKISPHRSFNGRAFDLGKFKAMKRAVEGATINDLVIATVAGGLRKYLSGLDELPDESLVAFLPMNVRTEKEMHTGGNIVSGMLARIRTDIEDPLKRLKAVRAETKESKELTETLGARTLLGISDLISPMMAAAGTRLLVSSRMMERMENPICNLVITNVPGPPIPLYMAGSRLVTTFGLGPVVDGVGLFVVIQSYCEYITISATADREAMSDSDSLMDCFVESYREMKLATLGSDEPSQKPVTQMTVKREAPKGDTKKKTKPKPKKKSKTKAKTKKKSAAKKPAKARAAE